MGLINLLLSFVFLIQSALSLNDHTVVKISNTRIEEAISSRRRFVPILISPLLISPLSFLPSTAFADTSTSTLKEINERDFYFKCPSEFTASNKPLKTHVFEVSIFYSLFSKTNLNTFASTRSICKVQVCVDFRLVRLI